MVARVPQDQLDTQVTQVRWDLPDIRVTQATQVQVISLGTLDILARQDSLATQVTRDQVTSQVIQATLDSLDQEISLVTPDPQDTPDLLVSLGTQATLVLVALLVTQGIQDQATLQDTQVIPDPQVRLVTLDTRVQVTSQDIPDLLDLRVLLVLPLPLELLVIQATQDTQVWEPQDIQDQETSLDIRDTQDTRVVLEPQELLASQDLVTLLGTLDPLDSLGTLELKERQEQLDPLDQGTSLDTQASLDTQDFKEPLVQLDSPDIQAPVLLDSTSWIMELLQELSTESMLYSLCPMHLILLLA